MLHVKGQRIILSREQGFTLIELIVVLLLIGILAVFAVPRVINTDGFNARGFHDETLAFLRYAQKTAIAQRRVVCVMFTASNPVNPLIINRAQLSVDTDQNALTGPNGCEASMTGPSGDSPGTITARGRVSYSAVPAGGVAFDALGQANAAAAIQVAGASNSITVEAVTGYAHQ